MCGWQLPSAPFSRAVSLDSIYRWHSIFLFDIQSRRDATIFGIEMAIIMCDIDIVNRFYARNSQLCFVRRKQKQEKYNNKQRPTAATEYIFLPSIKLKSTENYLVSLVPFQCGPSSMCQLYSATDFRRCERARARDCNQLRCDSIYNGDYDEMSFFFQRRRMRARRTGTAAATTNESLSAFARIHFFDADIKFVSIFRFFFVVSMTTRMGVRAPNMPTFCSYSIHTFSINACALDRSTQLISDFRWRRRRKIIRKIL